MEDGDCWLVEVPSRAHQHQRGANSVGRSKACVSREQVARLQGARHQRQHGDVLRLRQGTLEELEPECDLQEIRGLLRGVPGEVPGAPHRLREVRRRRGLAAGSTVEGPRGRGAGGGSRSEEEPRMSCGWCKSLGSPSPEGARTAPRPRRPRSA